MDELIRFGALGVGAGGLYALAAIGLVLIFRASRVVNFAQGAVGMVGGYVYVEAHIEHGVAWPLAMLLGFGGSALVGVAFDGLVLRRLRDASALTKTVATIALLVSLQGLAVLRYGVNPKLVPSILPNGSTEVLGTAVGQDRIAILAIAVLLTAVLWAIYRFTWFGVATSAVAENHQAASALAVSPRKIAAANWAIGSALGALATMLLAPITGLEPTSASFLVIPVLAAAVIGRFSSFPVTTAAGIAIGVAQSLVTSPSLVVDHWSQPGLPTAIPFVLVAVVLIVRGRSTMGKDEHVGRMPAVGTGRPAPGLIIAGVGATLLCLWVLFSAEWVVALQIQIVVTVVILSFVVVTGYAGQISLAQGALAGIGALVCGSLNTTHGWPLELAVPAGLAATVPVALILGLAGVRTRGVSLAIVTLGFAIAMGPAVFNNPDYTGGLTGGFQVDQLIVFGIDLNPTAHPERYATFALAVLVLLSLVVANLRRGRAGRRLIAVRTNERAASALGVSVVGAKLYAFTLGGILAAVGGILAVYRQNVLSFGGFGGIVSLFGLQNAVIGGVGLLGGPLVGSAFQPGTLGQEVAGQYSDDPATVLVVVGGFGLLALLSFAPDGLAALVRQVNRFWLEPLRGVLPHRPSPSDRLRSEAPDGDDRRVTAKGLAVEGLTVRFGGVTAVQDLDLTVASGEVVGLIGPNGAGKSTAIEAITGFVPLADGEVVLGETRITGWSTEARARAGLSRSFQTLELFEDLTVLENIQTACDERDLAAYATDLVRPGRPRLTAAAHTAVRDFGLDARLDTKVADLSYAERRMLAVARAVAVDASVLLLDEPASGLDRVQTERLGAAIRRLADERGVAVLLVEHNVDLVLRTCDRVYTLNFGHLIGAGTPGEVRTDPEVIAAYLGTARFHDENRDEDRAAT